MYTAQHMRNRDTECREIRSVARDIIISASRCRFLEWRSGSSHALPLTSVGPNRNSDSKCHAECVTYMDLIDSYRSALGWGNGHLGR